jgi:hypothetical protein
MEWKCRSLDFAEHDKLFRIAQDDRLNLAMQRKAFSGFEAADEVFD